MYGPPEDDEPPPEPGALDGLSVLVAEDHAPCAELIRGALAGAGAVVVTTRSNGEALAAVAAKHFDVRVVDRFLPDGDGYRVLVLGAPSSRDAASAFVCLSGLAPEPDLMIDLDERGAVVLVKPFPKASVVRAVLRACAKVGLRVGHLMRFGPWTFDAERRVLIGPSSVPVRLGRTDAAVLRVLLEQPDGTGLNAWQLAERALGRPRTSRAADNRVRQSIARLRRLIGDTQGACLRHTRQRGYWIVR